MENIILEFCVAAISVIATALSGYAVNLLRGSMSARSANSKGTMLLLQTQLIEYHEKWMAREYVTKYGLQNFLDMYNAYKKLGGDGLIDSLKKDIEALPIKKSAE